MEQNENSRKIANKKYVSVELRWYIVIASIYAVFYMSIINIQEKKLIPLILILPVIINILIVFFLIPAMYLTNDYIRFRKFRKLYSWRDIRKLNITITKGKNIYLNIDEAIVELYLKDSIDEPKIKVKYDRYRSNVISNIKAKCDQWNISLNSNINIHQYIGNEDIDESLNSDVQYEKKENTIKEHEEYLNTDSSNNEDMQTFKRKNRLKVSIIAILFIAIGVISKSGVVIGIGLFALYSANYGLKIVHISRESIKFDSKKIIIWKDIERIGFETKSGGRGGITVILRIFLKNSKGTYTKDILKISNKNDLKDKIKTIAEQHNIEYYNHVDNKFLDKEPWV